MIFKLFKIIVKAIIGIVIVGVILVAVVSSLIDGARSYGNGFETIYHNASEIVRVHQEVESADVGEICICAVCMKEKNTTLGATFEKKSRGMNSCKPEHEREYQAIYDAYMSAEHNERKLNAYGVKLK